MFGQTSTRPSGQWPGEGYSRDTFNKSSPSRIRNYNWANEPDLGNHDQQWHDVNTNLFQSPIPLSEPFSNQPNTSRGPWNTQPPPPSHNRKRPLPSDEGDFQASRFKSKSDSWPRTRTNDWPTSDIRSNDPRADWFRSEVGNNSWTDNKRSDTWPQSDGWSQPTTSMRPRPTNEAKYSKFPQTEGIQAISPWINNRPPRQANVALDIKSTIITTYYVNQKKVNMPKELTNQFGALNCDLCGILVNSTVTAKTHYTGKTHDKKVAQFMQHWFTEKGEPIPEQFKEGVTKKSSTSEGDPIVAFFCNVCNLPLTSKQHAEQHYMGKAHRRALLNGYPKKMTILKEQPDPTGRFQIGTKFIQASDPLSLQRPESFEQSTEDIGNPFFCKLCGVSTTSLDQLGTHIVGARHQKKLKAAANPVTDASKVPPPVAKGDSILATLNRSNNRKHVDHRDPLEKQKDFSIFRTPSGNFYCATCNLTMNSEMQFGQHNSSKKHKANISKGKNLIKPAIVTTAPTQESIETIDLS